MSELLTDCHEYHNPKKEMTMSDKDPCDRDKLHEAEPHDLADKIVEKILPKTKENHADRLVKDCQLEKVLGGK